MVHFATLESWDNTLRMLLKRSKLDILSAFGRVRISSVGNNLQMSNRSNHCCNIIGKHQECVHEPAKRLHPAPSDLPDCEAARRWPDIYLFISLFPQPRFWQTATRCTSQRGKLVLFFAGWQGSSVSSCESWARFVRFSQFIQIHSERMSLWITEAALITWEHFRKPKPKATSMLKLREDTMLKPFFSGEVKMSHLSQDQFSRQSNQDERYFLSDMFQCLNCAK